MKVFEYWLDWIIFCLYRNTIILKACCDLIIIFHIWIIILNIVIFIYLYLFELFIFRFSNLHFLFLVILLCFELFPYFSSLYHPKSVGILFIVNSTMMFEATFELDFTIVLAIRMVKLVITISILHNLKLIFSYL